MRILPFGFGAAYDTASLGGDGGITNKGGDACPPSGLGIAVINTDPIGQVRSMLFMLILLVLVAQSLMENG